MVCLMILDQTVDVSFFPTGVWITVVRLTWLLLHLLFSSAVAVALWVAILTIPGVPTIKE